MRIVFTRFPLESAFGGAEVQTLSLMKGLKERGHDVEFLGSCPVLLEKAKELGIKNYELRIGPPPVTKWGAFSLLWRQFGMKRKLKQALEEMGFADAIVMLSLSEKLLLTPLALAKGIHVFWLEHDRVGPWLSRNPWLGRLRALSKSVTTIAVSELSKKIYVDLGWDPAHVIAIPNGISAKGPRAKDHVPSVGTLRVGCVARLSYDKGVDHLIEAIKDLPNVTLAINGKGKEESALRARIARLNLGDRVKIRKEIPNIADFYADLDALVLPSREHDPFGLVAAEAMMLGIPVIVTDACGIAGYLTDGRDALVVKAGSSEALKNAVEKMMDATAKTMIAEAGKKTAQEKFSVETMIGRYEELLREAV